MSQAQNVYTIHENSDTRRNSQLVDELNLNSNLLVDTNSIPLTQQTMPPMPSHQHALQPQQITNTNNNNSQQVISSQPTATTSRVAPENQGIVYSVHPSFATLDSLDALLVKQQVDCERTCCGFESSNAYTVRTKTGEPVLKAIESLYL